MSDLYLETHDPENYDTVAMLESLVENIKQGNVEIAGLSSLHNTDGFEIRILLNGSPVR